MVVVVERSDRSTSPLTPLMFADHGREARRVVAHCDHYAAWRAITDAMPVAGYPTAPDAVRVLQRIWRGLL